MLIRRRLDDGAAERRPGAVRGLRGGAALNRPALTSSIILAVIMQGVDNTIATVALPHIQGSLSASQDQVAWVLTSYIVTAAITMPLSGWLATRFGIKSVFLVSIGGFTLASALCGSATSLTQLVLYRALQGICGAGLVPLAQSVLFQINPPERHGQAMAVFGTGAMAGPIMGPTLGGWLTDQYNWRWVFYINVPVGLLATIGILVFLRQARHAHREPFDFLGFATLSLGVGALQMMLDRGQLNDWFASSEIWIEAALSGIGFYLLAVHTATATDRSFLSRELLANRSYVAGTLLMFLIGVILTGTSALLPTMMQVLMNYPVFTAGVAMTPRGFGTMIAMFLAARIIGRVDLRLIILFGLVVMLISLWQMMAFSLTMNEGPIILSGLLQGFGLGCTAVPLNMIALSNLPRSIMTQGTALRSLMRNLGGSIGISILEAQLTQNTQTVHSRLVEQLRPDNPLMHGPYLAAPFSLTSPSGIAALNAEVTRQAAMVAYLDDFLLMILIILACVPLLLLVQVPSRRAAAAE
jgi:MFS transporter, DHA2 family, multidrug resistance protein